MSEETEDKTEIKTENEEIPEITELPAVAKTIYLPCKKCEEERYFKVLAHSTAKSAKVQCEVCGAKKTYRLPAKKKAKKKTTRRKKVVDPSVMWNELLTKIGSDNKVPYNMRSQFVIDSAIDHPKFGIGLVVATTQNKIDVVFQEGEKSLVHNRV